MLKKKQNRRNDPVTLRGVFRTLSIYKMEAFGEIVNTWKTLTISTKISFLDAWRVLNTPDSTFLRIIPVSPFSRRLASFSSLRRRSYLFLISRISRSASSSICFFVSSYSRNCCRDSSLAWFKWAILSKQNESNINCLSFERGHSFHRSDYLLQTKYSA